MTEESQSIQVVASKGDVETTANAIPALVTPIRAHLGSATVSRPITRSTPYVASIGSQAIAPQSPPELKYTSNLYPVGSTDSNAPVSSGPKEDKRVYLAPVSVTFCLDLRYQQEKLYALFFMR